MAGISSESYRVRIGRFATVATLLSCVKARCSYPYTRSTNIKTDGALKFMIRLSFVVLFLAVTGFHQQFPLVLDLTRFGDVAKNPGPDKAEIFYNFHEIGPLSFEKLAGFVVQEQLGFPVLSFSDGRDGGRDAVGIGVNIKQNDGTVLKDQNVVVQVKHTKNASEKLTKAKRGSVFGKEVKKVEELVQKKELHTYVIVTNYPVPGEQEGELKREFEGAGAKHVIVIGYETLSEWLYQSPALRRGIAGLYGVGNAQSLNLLKLYKDQVTQVTHITAFMNAEKKLEEEGLVFVIGHRRSGKTTVAKYLADKLSREYVFFHIVETSEFTDLSREHRKGKVLYFMDDVDQGKMEKWFELKDELRAAMDDGSKFVFTGSTEVYEFVKQKSEHSLHRKFYYQFCVRAINLSDQLSSVEKRKMLTNHIEKGDNDRSIQIALLQSNMLQHASERISCTSFPEVAYQLGLRDCVEQFRRQVPDVPMVYDEVFLDKFFRWVEDIVNKDKNSTETTKRKGTAVSTESCKKLKANNIGEELTEILCEEYERRARIIQTLPWDDTMKFSLDKIYTRLKMLKREGERFRMTEETIDLFEILKPHVNCGNPKTVLIEGSPGIGKTMLSLKLAYDWAKEKMPDCFPPFELVILIKCRDMGGDIREAIEEQLLPQDIDENLKDKFYQHIENHQDKVLLVLDGFDECSSDVYKCVMKLITRKLLSKCSLVVTSRQEKSLEVRKHFDTLIEIRGYSLHEIEHYIERYFESRDNPELADNLIYAINDDQRIKTLATIPLNTVLLCVVFEEYYDKLPSTITELYENICFCVIKRYCSKNNDEVNDDSLVGHFTEDFRLLGELALESLLKECLYFRESKLQRKRCTQLGFLYKDASERKIKPDHLFYFLHKTFQEYFAAFYLSNHVETEKMTMSEMVKKLRDTPKFVQVLMFISGMFRENDALSKSFVKELAVTHSPHMEKTKLVGILCAVLSERFIDEDMAAIVYSVLPEKLKAYKSLLCEYISRSLPYVLSHLCCEDGLNKEINFSIFNIGGKMLSTSGLRLICKAMKGNLIVQKLMLSHCGLIDEAADVLADMLSHNTTLTTLDLEFNNFTKQGCETLLSVFRQNAIQEKRDITLNRLVDDRMEALTKVPTAVVMDVISRNSNHREDGAAAVGDTLHTNNTLTELIMGRNPLRSEGVTYVAKVLESNKNFMTIELLLTGCDEKGAAAVADMLRINNTLTELDMGDNPLGSKGVMHLMEALKSNKALKILYLYDTKCEEDGASAVGDMLRNNNTLRVLQIAPNPLGLKGMTCIAEGLKSNKTLKDIFLDCPECGDEGAAAVADVLRCNKTLTKLSLCRCNIKLKGVVALAGGLKQNSTLKLLDLRGNDITDEGFESLAKAVLMVKETFVTLRVYYPGVSLDVLDKDTRDEVEHLIIIMGPEE